MRSPVPSVLTIYKCWQQYTAWARCSLQAATSSRAIASPAVLPYCPPARPLRTNSVLIVRPQPQQQTAGGAPAAQPSPARPEETSVGAVYGGLCSGLGKYRSSLPEIPEHSRHWKSYLSAAWRRSSFGLSCLISPACPPVGRRCPDRAFRTLFVTVGRAGAARGRSPGRRRVATGCVVGGGGAERPSSSRRRRARLSHYLQQVTSQVADGGGVVKMSEFVSLVFCTCVYLARVGVFLVRGEAQVWPGGGGVSMCAAGRGCSCVRGRPVSSDRQTRAKILDSTVGRG